MIIILFREIFLSSTTIMTSKHNMVQTNVPRPRTSRRTNSPRMFLTSCAPPIPRRCFPSHYLFLPTPSPSCPSEKIPRAVARERWFRQTEFVAVRLIAAILTCLQDGKTRLLEGQLVSEDYRFPGKEWLPTWRLNWASTFSILILVTNCSGLFVSAWELDSTSATTGSSRSKFIIAADDLDFFSFSFSDSLLMVAIGPDSFFSQFSLIIFWAAALMITFFHMSSASRRGERGSPFMRIRPSGVYLERKKNVECTGSRKAYVLDWLLLLRVS